MRSLSAQRPAANLLFAVGILAATANTTPASGSTAPISFDAGQGAVLPSVAGELHAPTGNNGQTIATHPDLDSFVLVGLQQSGVTVSELISGGFQPRFASTADLNGNGLIDIVTTSPVTGRAHVIRQTAPDQYTLGAVLPIGINPFRPVLADLDSDGLPELIVPLRGDHQIAILPNLGDGLFAAGSRIPTLHSPEAVAIADFDGDGVIDLAVLCAGANAIQVRFGEQTIQGLTFGSPITLSTGSGPNGLIVTDLDGDGRPDLATASAGSSSISIFYTRPGRNFEAGAFLFAGTSPQSIAAADLNQSGLTDLVVANPSIQSLTVLRNEGAGQFIRSTIQMPFRPARLALRDLNGNGLPDIVASSQTSQMVRILTNTTPVATCSGDVTGDLRVTLADLNLVLANFGTASSQGDANGDGVVNLADLNLVLANFGAICGET